MKGQTFSLDFVLASFVFVAIVIFMISFSVDTLKTDKYNRERKNMEVLTSQIVDQLVRTSGSPPNWDDNSENALAIGLADLDRRIDTDKLAEFLSMPYTTLKEKLHTEGYEFYFNLSNQTKGLVPTGERITYAKRFVMYNGSPSTLEFQLWE